MSVEIDKFEEFSIPSLVFQLGIPAMMAQFLNVLYSIVDRLFVSMIADEGELALAAIGICAPAITAISAFAFMIGIGGSSIMSINIGSNRKEEAQKAVNNSFLSLIVISMIITIILYIFEKPILYTLGASDSIYSLCQQYFTICLIGTIAVLIGSGMNHFLMAQGLSKKAMITLSCGAVTNIIFDPIFIFYFDMGIQGAALATILGQFVSMILVIYYMQHKMTPFHIEKKSCDFHIIKRIISIGGMSFLVTILDNLIVIFLNVVLRQFAPSHLGDQYIATAAVIQSFMSVIGLPAQGICSGCGTIFSYFFGKRNFNKIKETFRYLLIFCLGFMIILFIFVQITPYTFVHLFLNDQNSIEIAVSALRKYTLALPCIAIQFTYVQGMTSMGKIKYAFPMSVLRKIIYIIFVFLLPVITNISHIFYVGAISDFIGAMMTLYIYFKIALPQLKN